VISDKKLKIKLSQNATNKVLKKYKITTEFWLDVHEIEKKRGKSILFKRVSEDFKTQEKTKSETLWTPGLVITHKDWDPEKSECGEGKFHAVSEPTFGDLFRDEKGDRYIAIEIAVKDLYAYPTNPSYPHKIGFRKGKVLYECDRNGKKVEKKEEKINEKK
jgi:hypothetical protein